MRLTGLEVDVLCNQPTSRRQILSLGAFGVANFAFPANSQTRTSPSALIIPYAPNWAVPGPLARCNDLRNLISSATALRDRIRNNDHALIDSYIQRYVNSINQIKNEINTAEAVTTSTTKEQVLNKISLIFGLIIAIAGIVATGPIAIGATVGISIVGSTTIFGLQVINKSTTEPLLVSVSTSNRALLFGDVIASQSMSTGGRVVSHALSSVSLLMSLRDINLTNTELSKLQEKLNLLRNDAKSISDLLSRYSSTDRAPWKTILINQLSGTIDSLQQLIDKHSATDCIILPAAGPTMSRP